MVDRQNTWADFVYLSRDTYLDVHSDLLVRRVEHAGALGPGEFYDVALSLALPRGITGPYYVFVLTDGPEAFRKRGYVIELDESNNATASAAPMLIELPPPSDLQVEGITLPDAAVSGSTVEISYTVFNRGDEPVIGFWSDSIFLSADAIWDLGDRLIGTVDSGEPGNVRTILPGASYTGTIMARLPAVLPRTYRVIVRTDIFDDIFEGPQNANNTSASADVLELTVPTLQLDVPDTSTISTGQERLFRVHVPAGQTLEVLLDAAGGANELYARFEGLPNTLNYDAAFEGHLLSDQTLRVPLTEEGFYYIMVRASSAAPNTPFSIRARLLPFAIESITPDAVEIGRASCRERV